MCTLPIIKKISVQQKQKDRYNIFFDHKDHEQYAFSVSEEVLIQFDLRKGKELSQAEIERIFYHEEVQKAYRRAIYYLSYRMRSEKEVNDYLKEHGFAEDIIHKVIARLREQNYLNDQEFAKAYVHTQINTSDKGPRIIQSTLREKGIKMNLIEEVLPLFTYDLQLKKAKKLCVKQISKKKSISKMQLEQNLKAMLTRKGYGPDVSSEAIRRSMDSIDQRKDVEAIIVQGEKAWRKYHDKPFAERKLKVKQFLYRKGFSLEHIEEFLQNKTASEDDKGVELYE